MKILLILLLIGLIWAQTEKKPYYKPLKDITKRVLQNPDRKFEPRPYAKNPFKDFSLADLASLGGSIRDYEARYDIERQLKERESPRKLRKRERDHGGRLLVNGSSVTSFDTRTTTVENKTHWPGCVNETRIDNLTCGHWLYPLLAVEADRLCIQNITDARMNISQENYYNNNTHSYNCSHGDGVVAAWEITFDMFTYPKLTLYNKTEYDNANCATNYSACSSYKTYGRDDTSIVFNNYGMSENIMKNTVYAQGPVLAYMDFYDSLTSYSSGTYDKLDNDFHFGTIPVRVLGWDGSGLEYLWILDPGWGTDFGENGTFKIVYGDSGFPKIGNENTDEQTLKFVMDDSS